MFHAQKLPEIIKYEQNVIQFFFFFVVILVVVVVIVEIVEPSKILLTGIISMKFSLLTYKIGCDVQNEDKNFKRKCLFSQ